MCRGTDGLAPEEVCEGLANASADDAGNASIAGRCAKAPCGGVRHEQRFHLALQLAIVAAGRAQERPAIVAGPFQGVLKHQLDAIPPRGVVDHRSSYRGAGALSQLQKSRLRPELEARSLMKP